MGGRGSGGIGGGDGCGGVGSGDHSGGGGGRRGCVVDGGGHSGVVAVMVVG